MVTSYKCPNLGNCLKADQAEIVQIPFGAPVKCTECGASLMAVGGAPGGAARSPVGVKSAVAVAGLIVVAVLAWLLLGNRNSNTVKPADVAIVGNPTAATNAGKSVPTPPLQAVQTLLRFHGSNTLGGKLLPDLAIAYLKQEGYSNVRRIAGAKDEESFIVGERGNIAGQIEIHAHGSSTAFTDLKAGSADIGMSSRKIRPAEQQDLLAKLGDLSSNAAEHVLALDGIAVIVPSANPLRSLSLAQAADVFSGAVTDWSQLGGRAGPITVYARDNKSGTYEFFSDAVLKKYGKTLVNSAKRFEDSQKLADAVASDAGGIGFIGLNYIGRNKVLALSDTGVDARKPSLLTVKTEDYLLSRRLYLYTPVKTTNLETRKFIEYALGSSAQPVIVASGLIDMDPSPKSNASAGCAITAATDPRCQSPGWSRLTAGAVEIETRFRFRTGVAELDSRAGRDIGRIVGVLSQPQYQNKQLILIGFADTSGSKALNCKLSQDRADVLRGELAPEGLKFSKVVGLCAEAPVASNETSDGREKNRRVEVWIK